MSLEKLDQSNTQNKNLGGVEPLSILGTYLWACSLSNTKSVLRHAFCVIVKKISLHASELVQLKLNIGASDGDSTPPEVGNLPPPLIEVVVLEMDKDGGK